MNFFKKVITFFSAIWNAISWRKTDRKAKQVANPTKGKDLSQDETDFVLDPEKQFVDVPLHSSVTEEQTEQEIWLSDKDLTFRAPIAADNTEPQAVAGPEKENHSSGIQIFGFDDETNKTLSFFSEPVRDDEKTEDPLVSSNENSGEPRLEENLICETVLKPLEASSLHVNLENQVCKEVDLLEYGGLPTPPSEPVISEAVVGLNDISKSGYSAVAVASKADDLSCQTSTSDKPQATALNNVVPLESQSLKTENMRSPFPCHELRENNDHLNYSAIGDDMHLFNHDDAHGSFYTEDKCGMNEPLQETESDKPGRKDDKPIPETFPRLITAEMVSDIKENRTDDATSRNDTVPITGSVSSCQRISDSYDQIESAEKYSTNYMVKSDSLVNFLPEFSCDPDEKHLADFKGVQLEAAEKSPVPEEKKGIPFDDNIPTLKEGGMEEMMCTSKGVLKLSGDHHVDCNVEIDDPKENYGVKSAVDHLVDGFSFEEPLLITHHLEGSILEQSSLQHCLTEESPALQEALNTAETGLEDSESLNECDDMINDQYLNTSDAIGRCRSIILGGPDLPNAPTITREDMTEGITTLNDDDEGDNKSACRVKQFNSFCLEDKPDHLGNLKRNDALASGSPPLKLGEMPTSTGLSECVSSKRSSYSSNNAPEEGLIESFIIESIQAAESLEGPGWQTTMPLLDSEQVIGIEERQSTCLSIINEQVGSFLNNHENSCSDACVNHAQDDENNFYPFIDCSSYLFRIPEEIRKETNFNPCVGAAPFRRSGHSNSISPESTKFSSENEAIPMNDNESQNINLQQQNCTGTVPLIKTSIPDQYKNSHFSIAKLPEGYNHSPNIGTFWGAHPGLAQHGDQQQAVLGYPVSCTGYYEGENLNLAAYEHSDGNCNDSDGYQGFTTPYGEVEFPMVRIPLSTPQSPLTFIPRGTLAPMVFPIGPMNVPENDALPSLVSLEGPARCEQYSVPHSWGCFPANTRWQNVDKEEETQSVVEEAIVVPTENLSCGFTNNDDDDIVDNPIPDSYLQLAENNSLHAVNSKADSYSGSLFCESLRSLISHNTENEGIFPSFSYSSVQGCCPSIVLQPCETTLSNDDSLHSILVEQTSNNKRDDEDYLATEKFMNDVNTALNESVLDQIQARSGLHSNLHGWGDGSMPMNPGQSAEDDEVQANDIMVRNSLGENMSINNSKLTLLDGVLGTESSGNQPAAVDNGCDLEEESLVSAHDHFREVVDSLLENALDTLVDCSTSERHSERAETDADCRENVEGLQNLSNLIVQSMMFIEGMPDDLRGKCNKGFKSHDNNDEIVALGDVVRTKEVPELEGVVRGDGGALVDVDTVKSDVGDLEAPSTAAAVPNRRRGNRGRKRVSDIEPGVQEEPSDVIAFAVGDGARPSQDQSLDTSCQKTNEVSPKSSDPEQLFLRGETGTSNSKDLEEQLAAHENAEVSLKCEQVSVKNEDERHEHRGKDDDEPGENPGNCSNNRRRRNRRRKRKN